MRQRRKLPGHTEEFQSSWTWFNPKHGPQCIAREWNRKTTMAAYDRSTILPYQLEPTSTVADSESDTMNSYCSSDSDSCAAMSTENVVGIRAGNIDWCKCHCNTSASCCATAHATALPRTCQPDKWHWHDLTSTCVVKRNACGKFMPYTTRKVFLALGLA